MKIFYSTQEKSLNLGHVVEHVTVSGFYKYLLDLNS